MNNEIQFILYHLPDEEGKVQVVIKDETILATQKAMAQLFGVDIPAISKRLTHIFDEGELDKYTTVSKMEIVVNRGFRGEVKVKQVTGSCFTLASFYHRCQRYFKGRLVGISPLLMQKSGAKIQLFSQATKTKDFFFVSLSPNGFKYNNKGL